MLHTISGGQNIFLSAKTPDLQQNFKDTSNLSEGTLSGMCLSAKLTLAENIIGIAQCIQFVSYSQALANRFLCYGKIYKM